MKKSIHLIPPTLGVLLLVIGVLALAAPSARTAEAHGGHHFRVEGEIDEAELERHLEHVMRSLEDLDLSGLEDLDLSGLEDLGERISASVEAALGDLDLDGLDDDFDVHVDFDSARFERQMERMAQRLERSLRHVDRDRSRHVIRHRDRWDERSLRRQIERLEAELEDLRAELEEMEHDGEI